MASPSEAKSRGPMARTMDEKSTPPPLRKVTVAPKTKRKETGLMAEVCTWVVDHQIGLATNLLLLLALTHACLPRARRHTRKFFELSYYDSESGRYMLGWNDIFMVFYWIVLFTGLRAAILDFVLIPVAKWAGVEKRKGCIRFAEQAWLLIYYAFFCPLGLYIFYTSDYWLNLKELWTGWPDREMDGLFKWYYLVQFAFWLQQIFVVNIEERRKDYHQMFTHHIITCALIFASYGYHQSRVGNVILCLMDIVDVVLPIAKMLNYLHFQLACDIAFGVFLVTWFIARHVLYLIVCWSVHADIPRIVNYGCYTGRNGAIKGPIPAPSSLTYLLQPFRNPEGLVCWNNQIKWGFLSMLLALQVITIFWFGMIVRVAARVIRGGAAEDSRSDDEDTGAEDVDEDEDEMRGHGNGNGRLDDDKHHSIRSLPIPSSPPPAYLEEEVGVEGINLSKPRPAPAGSSGSAVRRAKKSAGSSGAVVGGVGGGASGVVTLPGHHSDRKELLGRIGCDKTT